MDVLLWRGLKSQRELADERFENRFQDTFSFQVTFWIIVKSDKEKQEKKSVLMGWGWFVKPYVNTCFSYWGTPYIHKHTHSCHGSLKVQLGWAQVTDSNLGLWEPLDASLPSTLSRIHVIKFLAFAHTLKTNTWTELRLTQKQKGELGWMTSRFWRWKNTLHFEKRKILDFWSRRFS